MEHQTICTYNNQMQFDIAINQHHFIIDANTENGGNNSGPSPKPLLLASLAGCTAMDIVSLLKKMHVNFHNFRVETAAPLSEEHPKVYESIQLNYLISMDAKDYPKMEKAVALSIEKYCGVYAMLSKAVKVNHQIIYQ
jgi:putative redox protein